MISRIRQNRLLRIEQLECRRVLTTFDLAGLLPSNGGDGTLGFVVERTDGMPWLAAGRDANGFIADTGDFNDDGIADIVFKASGAVFVVFGQAGGFGAELDVSTLNGTNGFRIFDGIGETSLSAANAGDFNGDGIDDILVGSPFKTTDLNGDGHSTANGVGYIVFGSSTGFPAEFDLVTSLDGTNGFAMEGQESYFGLLGRFVNGNGDFNGDGLSDIIVSEPTTYSWGPLRVGFGTQSIQDPFVPAPSVVPKTFRSDPANDQLWSATGSLAGDVNGDGFDDLVIGTSIGGSAYVILGNEHGDVPGEPDELDGTRGMLITGGARRGTIDYAGDLNGDGYDDIVMPGSNANATGRVTVIFGGPEGISHPFNADDGVNGTNGFTISGAASMDRLGCGVHTAGDVNGDGLDDLLIGSHQYDGSDSSKAFLVLGRTDGFPVDFDPLTDDRVVVFESTDDVFDGYDRCLVGAAGDINADGLDDIIIGGREDRYVVYGQPFVPTVGDFDGDHELTGADIDILQRQILIGGADPAIFDLDGDGAVSVADRDAWLLIAGEASMGPGFAFQPGDANLDGVVDVSDRNIWSAHQPSINPNWTAGNFALDAVVDTADYNVWNANKFTFPTAVWTIQNNDFPGRYLQQGTSQDLVIGTDVVEWDLTHTSSGLLIQDQMTGSYLTSDEWEVGLESHVTSDAYWNLIRNLDGSFSLQSTTTGRYLDGDGPGENWSVDLSLHILSDDKWSVTVSPANLLRNGNSRTLAVPNLNERHNANAHFDWVYQQYGESDSDSDQRKARRRATPQLAVEALEFCIN